MRFAGLRPGIILLFGRWKAFWALWRKLHVAVNQENHMIEACVLTDLGIVKDC